eukprot:TRINITY_DN34953_c0_g1_i4.p1 TRINITY_DN34953_c0_g1~~TRINITY_DN34953_c0_g1_i4.p1  ORF type:complete len:224 (-),score=51.45 TRINITY_DN34953_c0_g1_i4:90-761(-)
MAESSAPVLCSVDNGVATLLLNRPQEKNSLDASLMNALGDHLQACMAKDEVRVIVLTNTGNTFCGGANLKGGGEAPRFMMADILKLIQDGPKPVVGRINGHCTGGGVGLSAACDISVISSAAQVGFTEVRIGVAPAIISVVCLPKMRRADAAELMLCGEKISAERAAQAGLYNYAVAPEKIDVKAYTWTTEVSMKCFMSPEAREGIKAFRERVAPSWVPKAKL